MLLSTRAHVPIVVHALQERGDRTMMSGLLHCLENRRIRTLTYDTRSVASAHQHGPSHRTLELARLETRSQRWIVPVLPWPRRRRRCADARAGGGAETRERTIGTIPARRFHRCHFSTRSSTV